jgi:O-antigen ligase
LSHLLSGPFFRVSGFFVNANVFGRFLLFAIPAMLIGYKIEMSRFARLLYGLGLIAACLALLATWSRGAWGAAFVFLVLLLLLQRNRKLLLLLEGVVLVAAIAVLLSDRLLTTVEQVGRLQAGTTRRTILWRFGLNAALESPIMGRGFALEKGDIRQALPITEFGEAYTFHGERSHFNPHNFYIRILLGTGIPGFILIIIVYRKLFRTQIEGRRSARDPTQRYMHSVLLAVLIASLFTSMFESGPLLGSGSYANYFWILLGLVTVVRERDIRFR